MRKYNSETRRLALAGSTFLTIALAMYNVAPRLWAQDRHDRIAVEIDAYRPLAAALDRLEAETGVPVHYEDVPLEHTGDLETAIHPLAGARLLVARKGAFSAEIDVASARLDPVSAVQGVIGSYARAGLPGSFQVSRSSNGSLLVLPSQLRSASGKTKTLVSPLSAIVSLPTEERTVFDTFTVLLKTVSEASGARLDPGAIPIMASRETGELRKIRFGATRESGHDVLTRLIRELWEMPVSYRLLYDPMLKYYMFNLQPAIAEKPLHDGSAEPLSQTESPDATGNEFFVRDKP